MIHVNEHDSHRVAATAARLVRVPIATHLRYRPEPEYCRWLFRPPYEPDLLLFTSRTQMDDSAGAIEPVVPRDRWRLLPNGLDFGRYGTSSHHRGRLRAEWKLPDDAIALGIACAISPRKRVDHFVRLIAALRHRGVPAYGFIAGMAYSAEHGALLADLRREVAEVGLSEHVRFLGYVEPSEPLWHAWDIAISTSSYETFGMSVLEAMACGCPVVAYPGGSVQEVLGDSAAIVPDGDEEALCEMAGRLCGDRALRREAGEQARAHARRHYDIRRIVPLLAAAYRACAP
jgi:glycosyltransferase involved in cell wall biosynthesis